jgi:cyclophilin family peptidyl-prolyl cis-trans isomerase
MPKTVNKRAQAKRTTQIKQAHQTPPETVIRKVPLAKRRVQRTGPIGFARNFPLASSILVALLVLMGVLTARAARIGPFAPPQAFHLPCTLPKTRTWANVPAMTINQSKQYAATIRTKYGNIVIALDAKNAPNAVNNFVFLADNNYFCGTYFWRVEQPGKPSPLDGQPSQLSLVQGGAVTKDGKDSQTTPGYTIKDDPVVGDYTPGTVAMANTGQPNSASAQFFIDVGDESKFFSKTYTIFGTVTSGMDVVKKIQADDLIEGVTIAVK